MPLTSRPANLLGQFLTKNVTSSKVGVVVSAGKMTRAVKVRIAEREWNKHFRKYFPKPTTYLVADPNSSLVEGDVVRIASGHRYSKKIRHVVTSIVAPFGPPVTDRPPVLTEEQLLQKRLEARLAKDVRSKEKGRLASIWRIKEARKAGYKVPSLEEAMANVKIAAEKAEKEAGMGKKALAKAKAVAREELLAARENPTLRAVKEAVEAGKEKVVAPVKEAVGQAEEKSGSSQRKRKNVHERFKAKKVEKKDSGLLTAA